MIRVLGKARAALTGSGALLAGGALLLLATAAPAAAAAPVQRDISDVTPYVIRHVPSSDRMVPSGWSKDPAAVVTWGYDAPEDETETWEAPEVGFLQVGYATYPVRQIRNADAHDQCLEADGSGVHAYLYQRTCDLSDPAQRWVLVPSDTTDDAYRIAPVRNRGLAVTPQNPTSHSSYLWLADPTGNADWYFDLPVP